MIVFSSSLSPSFNGCQTHHWKDSSCN